MKNFKLTCPDPEPFTKVVAAATLEEAVTMLMADAEVQAHVAANHPEMAGKTPDELKEVVKGMVTEEAAAPAPAGGDMPVGGAV